MIESLFLFGIAGIVVALAWHVSEGISKRLKIGEYNPETIKWRKEQEES
jgi:hypothetical protein